ncbi:MarR family transcriptional regulator [Amycolatopsis sp. PS_44_ISF1]|uniref:MarR family winged helix-turn-helix transcriptional regulator n=1 Tax=Amycolatopsis sp. PS_44_ISF1 TaxID=2974917 RepID=UPI0028DE5E29|nr:MarR family transcriptional regulator [Amycolatopsis sp. PS_44_ISF1]MDT8915486.1 MarR family transcriptional regulator [Amycolatopsis sp. PS_44_ISF1]
MTEPDAPARADELAALARVVRDGVGRLNWRMRAESGAPSPGPMVLAVLSRLYRGGTHTPGELAEAERIHPQSLTRVLASLTSRELITRTPDPSDGRRSLIDITAAGKALLREYSVRREQWLATAMDRALSPTEQQLLRLAADLMARVAEV